MQRLTIVVPVHNEEACVSLLHAAVSRVMNSVSDLSWSLLFVDDGSNDTSLRHMQDLANEYANVGFIELSRNFGKEIATSAGLNLAEGDAVMLMDADLQHPPEYIPEFISKWRAGADMVIGIRRKSVSESLFKKWGSIFFNKVLRRLTGSEMRRNETDFRLISRPVLNEFTRFTVTDRMTRELLNWLGFKIDYVAFDPADRAGGEASYTFCNLVRLSLTSIATISFPIRIIGFIGWSAFVLGGVGIMSMLFDKYIWSDPFGFQFSGPAVLAAIMITIMGVILLCMRLVAWYVMSIQKLALNRPLYVIRSKKI